LYNTGQNRSFTVTKTIEMDAHPSCSTGNSGVQRSGKSANEPGDRRTHMLLPRAITSFNMSEDIKASERERSR